jgi:hypothetical protein
VVQALVDRGADVNQANVCAACVWVARALWPQHTEGWLALPVYDVVFCFAAFACLGGGQEDGWTPLDIAREAGHVEVVQGLLRLQS